MFRIKITYTSGYSDLGECDIEAEAPEAVTNATLRMMAARTGSPT